MADTKITGLAANTTPVSTDVTVIIDDPGGTPVSMKITLANLMALFANPVSDDGDGLGTTGLKWADLFLANGAVINFNSGDVTLTHGANILALGGGSFSVTAGDLSVGGNALVNGTSQLEGDVTGNGGANPVVLSQGATAVWVDGLTTGTIKPALTLIPGTLMTTPADGAVELDATNFYGTTDAGNRGYIPIRHYIRANTTRTLTSNTNPQAIFNSPANGRITLETGTYKFESMIRVSNMSATSGNAQILWQGAGTATTGDWIWSAYGVDLTDPTVGHAAQGTSQITNASAANIFTATIGTRMYLTSFGMFEVSVAGTLIPTIDLVTAAAADINTGSYFMVERIGPVDAVSVGQWD